jgi:hypothetical protein
MPERKEIQIDILMEDIRAEFQKLLEGPGISWNKVGMLSAFDRACIKGMVLHANKIGVTLV